MKTFRTLPILFLFAAACTDVVTGPPATLAPPTSPNLIGEAPPPPVDVIVEVNGAIFDGTYFSNSSATAFAAISGAQQGVCTFDGSSWLKFDNNQPEDVTASANARIKCSHLVATGKGTLQFDGFTVLLESVRLFVNDPVCAIRCGSFSADLRNPDGTVVPGGANGQIFDRRFCQVITPIEGSPFVSCSD